MAAFSSNVLTYEGCNFFRQRLILATLSGRSVKIKKIRYKDGDPGLKGACNVTILKLSPLYCRVFISKINPLK